MATHQKEGEVGMLESCGSQNPCSTAANGTPAPVLDCHLVSNLATMNVDALVKLEHK